MQTPGKLSARLLVIFAGVLILVGCRHLNYAVYHGSGVQQGTGGTVRQVNGTDIWENGTPNRRYTILGVTKQSRPRRQRRDERFDRELVKLARDHGGDALIIVSEDEERAGLLREKRELTIQVIRYEP